MARDSRLTGDAGTFLVAAHLALKNWPAALTSAGTTRTDLFAQVGERKLPVAIQVKTKSAGSRDFHVGVSDPADPEADEWVVLVALNKQSEPDFYVVPRNIVVATVKALDIAFDNPSRRLLGPQEFDVWKDGWDLMTDRVKDIPWRLRGWVFSRRQQMDWGPDHPGVPDDAEVLD